MTSPRVSVILPAYNQAAFVGEALRSVIEQSFDDWELIVVDDGSTDDTAGVVSGFSDPRIHLVRQENRGLPGARNSGIARARGEYLAFLDADDAFHPRKLQVHVEHLEAQTEVGLSYASRIEVDGQGRRCWFLRAPAESGLRELALGFPFTINDLLVRREWVEKIGGFDETFRLHSEDRDFYLRLGLEGCRMERMEAFVAYRRLHARRVFDRIPERIETMQRALLTVFDDPRCPPEVLAVREPAYARIYLTWALQELAQQETSAGQEHLRRATHLDPQILAVDGSGAPRSLLDALVWFSVREGGEHEERLEKVFAGLPPEYAHWQKHCRWAVGQGYLTRGGREVLWGRIEEGRRHFDRAREMGARFDTRLLTTLLDQLGSFEAEYGAAEAQRALHDLLPFVRRAGSPAQARWLAGLHLANGAFREYRQGRYARVPGRVLQAALRDPSRLADRGVLSIFARSLVGLVRA